MTSTTTRLRPARPPRPGRRVASAAASGVILAVWLAFAPVSAAGDYSYAAVRGDSMSPGLVTGDLVLLRREQDYGLGEVVAYKDPYLGPVLHRIVEKVDGQFTLRGDHRTQADNFHPAASDVLGRKVAVWYGGLNVVLALTAPATLAPFFVAFLALGLVVILRREGQRKRAEASERRRTARARQAWGAL